LYRLKYRKAVQVKKNKVGEFQFPYFYNLTSTALPSAFHVTIPPVLNPIKILSVDVGMWRFGSKRLATLGDSSSFLAELCETSSAPAHLGRHDYEYFATLIECTEPRGEATQGMSRLVKWMGMEIKSSKSKTHLVVTGTQLLIGSFQ
jgi:hypothetical protein